MACDVQATVTLPVSPCGEQPWLGQHGPQSLQPRAALSSLNSVGTLPSPLGQDQAWQSEATRPGTRSVTRPGTRSASGGLGLGAELLPQHGGPPRSRPLWPKPGPVRRRSSTAPPGWPPRCSLFLGFEAEAPTTGTGGSRTVGSSLTSPITRSGRKEFLGGQLTPINS